MRRKLIKPYQASRLGGDYIRLRRPSVMEQFQNNWQLYVLILPSIISVFIFHYLPFYGIQIAFKNYRPSLGIWDSEWVGLEHIIRFVNFRGFITIIWNTLYINLYSLLTFPCSIILALMINEIHSHKFKRLVQMVSYAPHFVSTVVLCSMLLLFLNQSNGLINNIIEIFGGERRSFMTTPEYFASIYVWSGVWQSVGWGSIIYIAALSSVSPELIEAAEIDGASRMQIITHVNIPSILPTIVIIFILSTGGLLSIGFEKIFLMQNPLNIGASRVISTYVYEIGLQGGQFSYASAIGLFNNMINITIIIIVNSFARKFTSVSLW